MSIASLMPLSRFIGRQRELADVVRLMHHKRLVTLIGPGGSGKTRLALQAAAHLADAFPDGAYVVELVPLGDEALVPQALASALGMRQAPGLSLEDGLERFLTPKTLLLVFDNCEPLIGDFVVLYLNASGTHTGPLAMGGEAIPPTGRQGTVALVYTAEVRDGRVVREWTYWDQVSMLTQLGLMPSGQVQ